MLLWFYAAFFWRNKDVHDCCSVINIKCYETDKQTSEQKQVKNVEKHLRYVYREGEKPEQMHSQRLLVVLQTISFTVTAYTYRYN